MRSLNVRLAAICCVVVLLLGGGVHLLHGFQLRRQADALKAASERAEEEYRKAPETADGEKSLGEAIRLLGTYVGLKEHDSQAHLRLGLLLAEQPTADSLPYNARSACFKLEEVLRTSDSALSPEDLHKARKKLVDMSKLVGRWPDALVHIEHLLTESPNDPELLDLYGQILVGSGKNEEARKQFERAIKIAPGQTDSYVRLADVLRTSLQRAVDADKVMLDMVVNQKDKDKTVEALRKYARYLLRTQEKYDEALKQAKRLLELRPEDPAGLWIAGSCYLANGQYKTAEEFLNRGIKADKRNADMYRTMAEVNNRLRRADEAIAVLRTGLENTKGTTGYIEILWDLTNERITFGKLDEAEKGLEELRGLRLRVRQQLVDFLAARLAFAKAAVREDGDFVTVKAEFADVLPKLHDSPEHQKIAYYHFGQCCRILGDPDGQVIAYLEAVKIDPYYSLARVGLAEILLGKGKLADAAEQYAKIVNGPHPDVNSAVSLARVMIMICLSQEKEKRDWTLVDKLLDQTERRWEMTANLAVLKAEVLLAKGSAEESQKLLERYTGEFSKNVQVWLALIKLPMYLARNATDPSEKEKRWQQASDYIDRATQKMGDSANLRSMRGALAVYRKDPQVAAVLKKLGENIGEMPLADKRYLWFSLGSLSVEANELDLGRDYYRLLAENDPKNIVIRCSLCDLTLRAFEKGQKPDLQELDKLLGEIERLGGRGPFWLYGKAIRILVDAKKDPQLLIEARGYLNDALADRKDYSPLAVLAGKICELQNEPDQALDYYRRAVYGMGERNSDVIRRTVQLLLPRGRIVEAGLLFDCLEKQKSPLLGEMNQEYVHVKAFRGDIQEAAKDVEKSVPADSRKYEDFLRQGQLYYVLVKRLNLEAQAAHRDAEAAKVDKQLSDDKKREKAGKAQQADMEMLKMAQRAMDALMKARELNPQVDEVWTWIVRLLVDVNQPDKAPPLIRDAKESLKGEKAPMTLAACWELLNETTKAQADAEERAKAPPESVRELREKAKSYAEKAQAECEQAVTASPQNSRVLRQAAMFYRVNNSERAEPLLKRIIELESPATLTDVCWARRNLAIVLKERGDFNDFQKGIALIDENLRSKARSIEDERTKVTFLLADPRKETIGAAISAMEEVVKGADATPDDQFDLAQLYLKKGDWPRYNNRMHSVLAAQKGIAHIQCLVFYITTLLENKKLDDVEKWLARLEKAAPNLFETVQLRAEYQFLCGNYKAAGDLAMAFLDNPKAQPNIRGKQLFLVATLMEKFGDRLKADGKRNDAKDFAEKADGLFDALRSKRVSETGDMLYATYLARQRRTRECLELLEKCWDKCPPAALQATAATLIHSKAASAAQYEQLQKMLVTAANKFDRPVPLLLILAELHTQQGQYDESIKVYREILKKEPRNFGALNNLGIDLARSVLSADPPTRSTQTLDEALKLVNDALAIRGPMAEVLDSRGVVYIVRQEPDKALEDLAAAIKDDGAAEQYFHQAWAYCLAGKKSEASAAFVTATKKGVDRKDLDPREVPYYDQLQRSL